MDHTPRLSARLRVANTLLTLSAVQHADRLEILPSELTIDKTHLRLQGAISRKPEHLPSDLRVTGTVAIQELVNAPWFPHKQWNQVLHPEGLLTVQLRATGDARSARTVTVIGAVRTDLLYLSDVAITRVSAEVEHARDKVLVRLLNADVAEGRVVGEFIAEPYAAPARYLVEVDANRLQLSKLDAAWPVIRDRGVSGHVSAHASLTGAWKDPSAVRGTGWLNASGEQLAEVPFLNRLMQGMFGALADRMGLSSLRTAQITAISGNLKVEQARISTEDFKLSGVSGAEPIMVYVRGSVGFDRTLDFTVEPEFSEQTILESASATTAAPTNTLVKTVGGLERLRRMMGRHRLTGTVDKPSYKFEFSFDQLFQQILPPGVQHLFESIR